MFANRVALTLWVLVLGVTCSVANEPKKPNILYILADDMGYGDPGFMGSKDLRTPNLDKLAKGGTILSSFYVQPVCSPTRSSLMTGRYVAHTGVYSVVRPNAKWGLPLEERTLAQAMHEVGYETAIDGKWHLGEFEPAYLPTHRGFDHQYGLWYGAGDYFTHKRGPNHDWHRDDKPSNDEGYSTHLIAKEAVRLIRERNRDKPLFLYLPFQAVHAPLEVPDSYTSAFPNLTGERRTYAGMAAAMDEAIGQVLAALDEQHLRENTLIIFSSDNGGYSPRRITSNGPLRAGKGTIYEGGVRVCACVNWAGRVPAGKTVDEPLHAVDWYPTLVKLAGGSLEQKLPLDGRDIWQVLTTSAKSPHDALLLSGMTRRHAAIRMGDWKLLVGASEQDAEDTPPEEIAEAKGVELYNLKEDIGEKNNLATKNPEKTKELHARLNEMLKTSVPAANRAARKQD